MADAKVYVQNVVWTVLSMTDTLAMMSGSGWRQAATESLVKMTKSPVVRDGKSLKLGGERTVKGTVIRHLPHVADLATDASGENADGSTWKVTNTFHGADGKPIAKADFLKLAKATIEEANRAYILIQD